MRLIEQIARQMASADNKAIFWKQYESHIRTVVKGIREPSPDMRINGGIAWSKALPTAETYVDSADACWKAMIDTLLNEESQ